MFSRAHKVFETKVGRPVDQQKPDREIEEFRKTLAILNIVISEVTEELIREKKLGG